MLGVLTSSLNLNLQLIAQLVFVAILPYLNPNGVISRGSGSNDYDYNYDYGLGEYFVEQEYHTDYYGNRYENYDRKEVDERNKLLDIELQKLLDIKFDGDKPSITVQKLIVPHLDEEEEDYQEEQGPGPSLERTALYDSVLVYGKK